MNLFRPISLCVAALLMMAVCSWGQEEAPPLTLGNFETQGSATVGYRFADVKGSQPEYLELFDLKKGMRLMDFNLLGRAKEGTSPFADSYSLTLSGLGGDPYPGGQLTVTKDKLYDLRVNYRQSYFYMSDNLDGGNNVAVPTALNTPAVGTPYYVGHGLQGEHAWATVRKFGSVNFLLHATKNLRFGFEYERNSRDGMTWTTRSLDYTGDPSAWGSFSRAFPYYVGVPVNELSNRITGSLDYTLRDWNFHYRIGYQTFDQNLTGNCLQSTGLQAGAPCTTASPGTSINTDIPANSALTESALSYQEYRRLTTPVSEFSYDGKVNSWFELRGGYIFYRYGGPATRDAGYSGIGPTTTTFTLPAGFSTYCKALVPATGANCATYSISTTDRVQVSEPNNIIDQGFTLKLRDWWKFHADYRYSRFTENGIDLYHTLATSPSAVISALVDGTNNNQWHEGLSQLDLNMEFVPANSLVIRAGIRLMKNDIESLVNGAALPASTLADPTPTLRVKTVSPTFSLFYKPSKIFSVRGDFQSTTNGAMYTAITPHTDVGGHIIVRLQPWSKFTLEESLVLRNRQYLASSFQNNTRTNAFTASYSFTERISAFAGLSYDSNLDGDQFNFVRGIAPLTPVWSDRFINRVWQGGLSAKLSRYFGANFSGNFVRTTGLGQVAGEPPIVGPMTWPLATATVWGDFKQAGRVSIDLQRTYYIEQIASLNNFSANLLTIRWTRDF